MNERRNSGKGKEKKITNPQKSPALQRGANDGRGPGRDVSLPVSIPIVVDAGGELHEVNPRRPDTVDVGLSNSATEPPVDWEQRIARMVETALAFGCPG